MMFPVSQPLKTRELEERLGKEGFLLDAAGGSCGMTSKAEMSSETHPSLAGTTHRKMQGTPCRRTVPEGYQGLTYTLWNTYSWAKI